VHRQKILIDKVRPVHSGGRLHALIHTIPEPYQSQFLADTDPALLVRSNRGKVMIPFLVWQRWMQKQV
jgi:hypothetical protein